MTSPSTDKLQRVDLMSRLSHARRLRERGELKLAQAIYADIIKSQPKSVESLYGLGVIAALTQEHKKALIYFDKALAVDPRDLEIRLSRGLALEALDDPEAALENYAAVIATDPNHPEAYLYRGNLLKRLNRLQEALASFDRAIEINGNYTEAYVNRGIVHTSQRRLDAALADFDRAIALNPHSVKGHCNRAFTKLLAGDFAAGWAEYEWRWKLEARPPTAATAGFATRLWLGDAPIEGKTLLVYSEQGFGDTLQFCRYTEGLASLGARVILAVQEPLIGLLASLRGVHQLIGFGAELPPFDYQCPLLSLPLAFRTALETIPHAVPYLYADPAKQAEWQARLGAKSRPRIGLVWNRGKSKHTDRNRSLKLADWLPHLPGDFHYVVLQPVIADADRRLLRAHPYVTAYPRELRDFSDTAALCMCLDLVVTIDTSVAHLSGALGLPTWVLLPFDPGWRWLLDREDSPWYPTMRLFRQSGPGPWESVFERLRARLVAHFAARDTVGSRDAQAGT